MTPEQAAALAREWLRHRMTEGILALEQIDDLTSLLQRVADEARAEGVLAAWMDGYDLEPVPGGPPTIQEAKLFIAAIRARRAG